MIALYETITKYAKNIIAAERERRRDSIVVYFHSLS